MQTQNATVSSSYVLSAIEGGLKVTEIIVTEHPTIKEIITPGIVGVSRAVVAWSKKPSEYAKGQVVKVNNLEELKDWLVGKPEIKNLLVDPKRKVTGWSFLLIQRGKSIVRIALVDGTAFTAAASKYMLANPTEPVLSLAECARLDRQEPAFDKMTVKQMQAWLRDNGFKDKMPKSRIGVSCACDDLWETISENQLA